MSWNLKVGWLSAPFLLVLCAHASAQKINFHGAGPATVVSRLVSSRAEVAPVDIRLTVPSLDVEKERDGFDRIAVPGLVPMSVVGNPDLYTSGALLAVPDGFEPELSVISQEERKLENVLVRPYQHQFRCGVAGMDGFEFNRSIYASTEAFPASPAEIQEVGRLQSLRLVRVALNPIRQIPAERALVVTTDLHLRVQFREVHGAAPVRLPRAIYDIARNSTVNGQGLGQRVVLESGPELMVIVTADALKSALSPLVAWKQAKGVNVKVVTNTEAGKTKEEVKKFVKNLYDTSAVKPSYLLFVGNKTSQPTFMESTGSGSAASDWQYSLLGGQENIPDVLYGRLVADNEAEVTAQVSRWIAYEKSPESGASWYPQGTTIASSEGSNPSDKEYAEQIQAALKAGTYTTVDGFYQGEQTATSSNITGALSEGRTWISYFGHGSGTSWGSTNDSFNVSTVGSLANTDKLPVIIDVACQNGSWVNLSKCFGKAWVTQVSDGKSAGAVAFYGGSVNISWHEPAVMSVGISKNHFEKSIRTLGGSVLSGQLYLFEKMGTGSNTLDNLKWYNLLGDPSLLIRTNTPVAYEVKHSTKKKANGRIEIQVTTTDGAGNAVAGILAAASVDSGSPVAVGVTDTTGQATLSVSGVSQLEPNTVLTTSGYNAETKQVVLQ